MSKIWSFLGFASNREIFSKIGAKIDKGGYLAITSVATLFSGFFLKLLSESGFNTLPFWRFLFLTITSALFLIFGIIGGYKDSKKLLDAKNEIQKKFDELDRKYENLTISLKEKEGDLRLLHEKLVRSWLKNIDVEIRMENSERVSIYFVKNDEFYILGRYSQNPKLEKIHTQKFALDKGVLSLAWENGQHTELSCPVYKDSRDSYVDYIKKTYGYSEEIIDRFTMKSCNYIGVSIEDRGKRIGVMLFESEAESLVNKEDDITTVMNSYSEQIRGLIVDGQNYYHVLFKDNNNVNAAEIEVMNALSSKVEM